MSDRLRVGRFVATLSPFGSGSYRYWARHSITGRCRQYGLRPDGYASAQAALVAMGEAERVELENDPTDEAPGRPEITEKVEAPHGG